MVAAVTLQPRKLPSNMSQSPHWAVLMRFTKELGWEDVHGYILTRALTDFSFVALRRFLAKRSKSMA